MIDSEALELIRLLADDIEHWMDENEFFQPYSEKLVADARNYLALREDYDSFDSVEELFEDLHAEDVQAPDGDFLKNYPEVTRVEVITDDGREFVRYDCNNVQLSLQDDGRTLKVFLKQEQISEEENEVRFKECLRAINNLKPGDITELMGEAFMEEFRRVSQ
jgi:hypothetical protein